MAITGLVLNDQSLVTEAFYDPGGGFFAQLDQGAAADGFWWEGSWGYHLFAVQGFLYLAEMGERAGLCMITENRLFRNFREAPASAGHNSGAEQMKACSAIHLTFEHLQPIDLPFHLPIAPGER